MRSYRPVTRALPVLLIVISSELRQTTLAQESDALRDLLAQARALADQGSYADALRTVITALEAHPNELGHGPYDEVRKLTFDWFGKVPQAQRATLLGEYESVPGGPADADGPLLSQLLAWLDGIFPTISVKTPGAMLVLAGWHRQLGNPISCVVYAITAFERGPKTPAGEHAIQTLAGWQYYSADREGMAQTVRVAARVDPDGWPACWALCRMTWYYGSSRRIDEAKALCQDVRAIAPSSRVAGVANQIEHLIQDLETMSYPAALDRLWGLRAHFFDETPGEEVMDTLCLGIEWSKLHSDPLMQQRFEGLKMAAEAEALGADDPLRKACAQLALGHLAAHRGRKAEAAAHFEQAAATGHWAVEEFALKQMARELLSLDPERAAETIERWMRRYRHTSFGDEVVFKRLAGLYQDQGRFAEALALYQELEQRCQTGQAMVNVSGKTLTAGIAGCLYGLGRDDQAEALAAPLLERLGHYRPIEMMTGEQLGALYVTLTKMGRIDEAEAYKAEMHRRAKEKLAQQE